MSLLLALTRRSTCLSCRRPFTSVTELAVRGHRCKPEASDYAGAGRTLPRKQEGSHGRLDLKMCRLIFYFLSFLFADCMRGEMGDRWTTRLRPRLAVDRRLADEPRVKRVDARGADNDLACAFVFLVKPAGLHHDGDDPAIIFVFLVVCAKPAATLVPRHLQAHRPPSARSQSRQLRQHRAEAEEQVE